MYRIGRIAFLVLLLVGLAYGNVRAQGAGRWTAPLRPLATGTAGPNYLGDSTYTDRFCSNEAPFHQVSACVSTTGTWFHDDTVDTDWVAGPSCQVQTYNGFKAQLQYSHWQYTQDQNGNRDILFECEYSQSLAGETTCPVATFVGDPQGDVVQYYNGAQTPPCTVG